MVARQVTNAALRGRVHSGLRGEIDCRGVDGGDSERDRSDRWDRLRRSASVGAQIGEWLTDQTQPPESRALSVSLQKADLAADPVTRPPTANPAARKYCGLVHDSIVGEVKVSIVSGPVLCTEALHVIDMYFNHPPSPAQGSGGFLAFDGWECISTSGDVGQQTGHYSDCEKGANTNVGNGHPIGSAISVDRP